MKKIFLPKIDLLICLIPAVIFIYLSFHSLGPFEFLEKVFYDIWMRLDLPQNQGEHKIAIVNIDEKSLNQIGPWPWPRHVIAEMVNILKENNAKAIGLDLPFSEKEPNQGLREIRGLSEALLTRYDSFSLDPWLVEFIGQIEKRLDNDRILLEAVKNSGNVILPVKGEFGKYDNQAVLRAGSFLEKNSLLPEQMPFSAGSIVSVTSLAAPFGELADACLALGHDNFATHTTDRGYLHLPFINYQGRIIPSMSLRLALAYLAKSPQEVFIPGRGIKLKDQVIPIYDGGIHIKFKGANRSFPYYSFVDILNVKKVPAVFNDKIVLIGYTADETASLATPVDPQMPQVEWTANVIEDFIEGRYVTRSKTTIYFEIILLCLFSIGCAFLLPCLNPIGRLGVITGLLALTFLSALSLFIVWNIWLKTVYIFLSLTAIYTIYFAKDLVQRERSLDRYSKESIETNRMFGLSLQSQGMLDLAFDKFRKCPLDDPMKDIIYNLGLDYERKRMIHKAVSIYEYIAAQHKTFRDLPERLPKLKALLGPLSLRQATNKEEKNLLTGALDVKPTVGRYQILEEIGQGAMGIVYKAHDPQLQRLLAIKTIRFSDDFEERKVKEIKVRFLREAEISGKLSHPSIVAVYDAGEDFDLTYLAMEYIEGENLLKYCQKDTLLPVKKVLYIISETALALDYAHQQGVIHRDIKPANIMLLKNGKIKVTDFGIAKAVSSSQTRSGIILGTPNYMSPEQINGSEIDGRSDIFSLGVVFYELVTGQLPFRGKTLTNLFYKITQVRHPPISEANPSIPKPCEQIIDKALAKDADQRFQKGSELARFAKALLVQLDQAE